jgi:hypothetical protein
MASFRKVIIPGEDGLTVSSLLHAEFWQPICIRTGRAGIWLDPNEAEALALALLEAAHSPLHERIEVLQQQISDLAAKRPATGG